MASLPGKTSEQSLTFSLNVDLEKKQKTKNNEIRANAIWQFLICMCLSRRMKRESLAIVHRPCYFTTFPSLNPPHFIFFCTLRHFLGAGGIQLLNKRKKKSQVLNFFKTRERESFRVWVCSLHPCKKTECRLHSIGSALCFLSVSQIALKDF